MELSQVEVDALIEVLPSPLSFVHAMTFSLLSLFLPYSFKVFFQKTVM